MDCELFDVFLNGGIDNVDMSQRRFDELTDEEFMFERPLDDWGEEESRIFTWIHEEGEISFTEMRERFDGEPVELLGILQNIHNVSFIELNFVEEEPGERRSLEGIESQYSVADYIKP